MRASGYAVGGLAIVIAVVLSGCTSGTSSTTTSSTTRPPSDTPAIGIQLTPDGGSVEIPWDRDPASLPLELDNTTDIPYELKLATISEREWSEIQQQAEGQPLDWQQVLDRSTQVTGDPDESIPSGTFIFAYNPEDESAAYIFRLDDVTNEFEQAAGTPPDPTYFITIPGDRFSPSA